MLSWLIRYAYIFLVFFFQLNREHAFQWEHFQPRSSMFPGDHRVCNIFKVPETWVGKIFLFFQNSIRRFLMNVNHFVLTKSYFNLRHRCWLHFLSLVSLPLQFEISIGWLSRLHSLVWVFSPVPQLLVHSDVSAHVDQMAEYEYYNSFTVVILYYWYRLRLLGST